MSEQWKLGNGWFLQKSKKVVRIVVHGPAISQSDCRKAGPYHSSYNKLDYNLICHNSSEKSIKYIRPNAEFVSVEAYSHDPTLVGSKNWIFWTQ